MPEISIRNFSCIQEANIVLRRLNIIIGPQGSGKSVTTKLIYFFSDIHQEVVRFVEDGVLFSEYKKHVQKMFSIWFPQSAWGGKHFLINYVDGDFSVRVMRRKSGGKPIDEVTIKFSTSFESSYGSAVDYVEKYKEKRIEDIDPLNRGYVRDDIENSWRMQEKIREILFRGLNGGVVSSQTFIPAGRAFFTSIGRLVAGIEHAGSLDPATLKFAKLFANWRDQLEFYLNHFGDDSSERVDARNRIMNQLFDGVVQSRRESEFIDMSDGRRVPFSSLSSGQQELLPIWYFIDNLLTMDAFRSRSTKRDDSERGKKFVYIEEPEAHLFPQAQSQLLDILVEVVLGGDRSRNLILTTHSPYIMSKLNVLLKAGQISRRKKKNKELGAIVDRKKWLQVSDVVAISIEDGVVKDIMDREEELIDAAFLDSISNITAMQFSELLDLEDSL